MSWAEDNGIDGYEPEVDAEIEKQTHTIMLGNGTEICKNCGSKNIKTSSKGNRYCADICWVDDGEDEAMGMSFQDWRIENDHE